MNKVILMGRLTRDAEVRQTASGITCTRFSIAVNRRFAKEGQQQADFINCVAWRQTGEFIAKYFGKGSMIAVVGNLQMNKWVDNDGVTHTNYEVVVDEAYFTGSKAETQTAKPYKEDGYKEGYSDTEDGMTDQASEFDDFEDYDYSEEDLPF